MTLTSLTKIASLTELDAPDRAGGARRTLSGHARFGSAVRPRLAFQDEQDDDEAYFEGDDFDDEDDDEPVFDEFDDEFDEDVEAEDESDDDDEDL